MPAPPFDVDGFLDAPLVARVATAAFIRLRPETLHARDVSFTPAR